MSVEELEGIADGADFIVNGYAFSRFGEGVRVINLRSPHRAAVLTCSGELVETSMDDVEIDIVRDYLSRNAEFLAA